MMVLLDTSIILDALMERAPFDMEAKQILLRSQSGELHSMFTANAATDIFYLYSKARDMNSAKLALDFLFTHYGVISVTHEDCLRALTLSIDDFEDALVAVCAEKAGADYIITRDESFIQHNPTVKAIKPKNFIDTVWK